MELKKYIIEHLSTGLKRFVKSNLIVTAKAIIV